MIKVVATSAKSLSKQSFEISRGGERIDGDDVLVTVCSPACIKVGETGHEQAEGTSVPVSIHFPFGTFAFAFCNSSSPSKGSSDTVELVVERSVSKSNIES